MREAERRLRRRLRDDFPFYAERCLSIRPKAGGLIAFRLNAVQRFVHARLEDMLARRGRVRALVLKARQPGVSTYVEGGWFIHDAAREGHNPLFARLEADTNIAENANSAASGGTPMDFLSNGVKLRMTTATLNGGGSSFVFAAFAENPFGGLNVSPVTAR